MSEKTYIAIDLKSFYASVEAIERGLDPLTTNLVVADSARTEKTICLAVTPALKSFGIGGRARLFEVKSDIISNIMNSILTLMTMGKIAEAWRGELTACSLTDVEQEDYS